MSWCWGTSCSWQGIASTHRREDQKTQAWLRLPKGIPGGLQCQLHLRVFSGSKQIWRRFPSFASLRWFLSYWPSLCRNYKVRQCCTSRIQPYHPFFQDPLDWFTWRSKIELFLRSYRFPLCTDFWGSWLDSSSRSSSETSGSSSWPSNCHAAAVSCFSSGRRQSSLFSQIAGTFKL